MPNLTVSHLGPGHTELESRWFQSKDFLAARESRSHYVFKPGALESRSDCANATYPSIGRLPHRRNTKVSQIVLVFPVWEELLDIAEGAHRSSVTLWRRPKPCPLLRRVSAFENSSWKRTNLRSCNIDMPLTEKYLIQLSRRPPPPCEAPAYYWQQPCAVSDAWLYFTQGNMQERKAFSSKNLTWRPEKAHPWKRIVAIQNRLDRIFRAGAILTGSILTRLMRKFMRIALETVIVWVRIARF